VTWSQVALTLLDEWRSTKRGGSRRSPPAPRANCGRRTGQPRWRGSFRTSDLSRVKHGVRRDFRREIPANRPKRPKCSLRCCLWTKGAASGPSRLPSLATEMDETQQSGRRPRAARDGCQVLGPGAVRGGLITLKRAPHASGSAEVGVQRERAPYALRRLALFVAKRHKRASGYGMTVVAYVSSNRMGLVNLDRLVVTPSPFRDWRAKPNAAGEGRR
jgi:hypothetical protein